MVKPLIPAWARVTTPVIGMVHLRPLLGSPRFAGDAAAVRDAALRDAEALQAGGVDGLMIENFGDAPFHAERVPPETVAHMTAVAQAVGAAVDLPVGVNVLRNDAESALAVAAAVGGAFIRVNVLHGAMLTDQGVIEGRAADVMRRRRALGAEAMKVLADVRVKHARPLVDRAIDDEVRELCDRCLADALIVSGSATGAAVDESRLAAVKAAAGDRPVFVGSGVTAEQAAALARVADGLIIGTHFKRGQSVEEPVDVERVRHLVDRIGAVSTEPSRR